MNIVNLLKNNLTTIYQKYFKDRSKAIAYKLTNIKKYDSPKELSSYGIKAAPQSFVYIQI